MQDLNHVIVMNPISATISGDIIDPTSDSIRVSIVGDVLDSTNDAVRVNVITSELPSTDLAKVRTANSTDATFPSKVPTVTAPSGDGVLTWTGKQNLILLPYGVGANNTTFDIRVIGWNNISTLYIPVFLCQASCTISTAIPGVAAQPVLNTEFFCDTISVTNGVAIASNPVADTQTAYLNLAIEAYDFIEVIFDMTGATSANALWEAY